MKELLALTISVLFSFQLNAQAQYTISIPTTSYSNIKQPEATDALDIQHIIDEVVKYVKIYQRNACVETLNPEIEKHLKAEMRKIREGTSYILTVDYELCEFIGLYPDKGTGAIANKSATIYYIKLYQDITLHQDFPSIPLIKDVENSSHKRPLIATYKNDAGYWIAWDRYGLSGGYQNEQDALISLFYTGSNSVFLCKKGKYNIYADTKKSEHDPYETDDVRAALTNQGITELPE